MSNSRKDTLVFWKNKSTNAFGGSCRLHSREEADELVSDSYCIDSSCKYISVTLTETELQQITDDKSVEKFNPFSPQAIFYKIRGTLMLGLFLKGKNTSPLKSAFAQNSLFDPHIIKDIIFPFLEPENLSNPKKPCMY